MKKKQCDKEWSLRWDKDTNNITNNVNTLNLSGS